MDCDCGSAPGHRPRACEVTFCQCEAAAMPDGLQLLYSYFVRIHCHLAADPFDWSTKAWIVNSASFQISRACDPQGTCGAVKSQMGIGVAGCLKAPGTPVGVDVEYLSNLPLGSHLHIEKGTHPENNRALSLSQNMRQLCPNI